MLITIAIAFLSALFFLLSPENSAYFCIGLSPFLKGIQTFLLIAIPFAYSMLGRFWMEGDVNNAQAHIFFLWYKRRKLFFIIFTLALALTSVLSIYLAESIFINYRALFSLLSWIFIGLALDFFIYTLGRIERATTLKASFITLQSEISRSIRKRQFTQVLFYYEILFVLIGRMLQTRSMIISTEINQEIISTASLVADAMPKMTLYQKDNDTLLDRMMMLESLTSKRVATLIQEMMQEYRKKADSSGVDQLSSIIMQLFLLFHEKYPSIGFIILQTTCSLITDGIRVSGAQSYQDNPVVQFSIILSEGIKVLIDRAVVHRRDISDSLQHLFRIIESLMIDLFRLDRSMNPALLMQPFAEIASYLANPQFEQLPQKAAILTKLKQHLSQFAVLETVSQRLDISGLKTDTESSYIEDFPFQKK